MAVYERIWRRYEGGLTPLRWRAAIITRYALQEAFASRIFTAFFVLCLLPTFFACFAVYLSSNEELLAKVQGLAGFVDWLVTVFVQWLFIWQSIASYLIVVIVAPPLISSDLQDNGLSLYLSRPISRIDYVAGKLGVLFIVVAPVTWISGLLVTGLSMGVGVEIPGISNLRLALAYLAGHLVWFFVVSLLALAVSALVRFKPAARGVLFAIIFILSGFAQAVNGVTGTSFGDLVHLTRAIGSFAFWILGLPSPSGLPIWANLLTLLATLALSIWILHRKLRAHEVVK